MKFGTSCRCSTWKKEITASKNKRNEKKKIGQECSKRTFYPPTQIELLNNERKINVTFTIISYQKRRAPIPIKNKIRYNGIMGRQKLMAIDNRNASVERQSGSESRQLFGPLYNFGPTKGEAC